MMYLVVLSSLALAAASNVKYVNPMLGTDRPSRAEYGGMIPSVAPPFAMTRWTPTTQENVVGSCPYLYNNNSFHGFLGTHQPAVWMGESAQIAVAPGSGEVKPGFADRGLTFSHDNEVSTPQYYKTLLETGDDNFITAELAATSRAASIRFTYNAPSPYALIQVTREGIHGEVTINEDHQEIYGYNPERQDSVLGPFTADDFRGYFVARFDTPFTSYGIANSTAIYEGASSSAGDVLSAYVRFDSPVVNIRVGVSFISYDQARYNLDHEIPDGTELEDVSNAVEAIWAEKLDRVELANASEDDLVIFYTAMYHALQYPCEMMETNASGTYYYSGFDNQVHEGEFAYTGYSIWDTFRAEWAFLNLFAPERINGMITSMLQTYKEGGRLPIWQNIVETNIMIGTHSSSLIAESLAKGFRDFDLDVAWEAIWKDAMVPPENDLTTIYYDRQQGTGCEARAGLTREKELGWVAAILTSEAGSRTLEYAYDDYTVAVAAAHLGHPEAVPYFLARSKNYRNIFNNETMLMEARYANGSWCADPNTWTEATAWVYTFNVQHDFPGLRDLYYGAEGLEKVLDAYYNGGYNDQTNEPSHATVFAYLYANQPAKAQSMIRTLLQENYFNSPIGLSGNDDCGQMSAWYVFNTLGFYPVNPASAEYLIGTPYFDKVTIRLPQTEEVLTITAPGARENMYVAGVRLDGDETDSPVLKHDRLMQLKELSFEMASAPQEWGRDQL